ncbi:MAG: hypothetical protein ABJN40_05895 [Sneathiella sp.]
MNSQPKAVRNRISEISLMTNEEKGFYLLDAVRQLSFRGGDPEEQLIYLLVDRGGVLDGILAADVKSVIQ